MLSARDWNVFSKPIRFLLAEPAKTMSPPGDGISPLGILTHTLWWEKKKEMMRPDIIRAHPNQTIQTPGSFAT
jgi:hypothetical protein